MVRPEAGGGGGGTTNPYNAILETLERLLGRYYAPSVPGLGGQRDAVLSNLARARFLEPDSDDIFRAINRFDGREKAEFSQVYAANLDSIRDNDITSMGLQRTVGEFVDTQRQFLEDEGAFESLGILPPPGAGDRDPRPAPDNRPIQGPQPVEGAGQSDPSPAPTGTGGAGRPLIDTPAGDPGQAVQVPGGGQVWLVDGQHWYMAYTVPGTSIPMLWHIEDDAQLQGITGGRPADRQVTSADLQQMGALHFGQSKELINTSEHPFEQFVNTFTTEAAIRPWLRDPEIMALTAMAILEGREVSEAEMKTTDWWQNHSEAERQWISLSASDPATASQQVADNRTWVAQQMQALGVTANDDVVNFIADRMTSGLWSQQRTAQQLAELANPASAGGMDPDLKRLIDPLEDSGKIVRAADDTTLAREKVLQYLGPMAADQFTDEQLRDWGRAMRASETEVTRFEGILSKQFDAMFPEFKGTGATYEDVAGPARALFQQVWGQRADERDPLFLQVARTQDLEQAAATLRRAGVKKGVSGVVNDLLGATLQASGGQVRGAL